MGRAAAEVEKIMGGGEIHLRVGATRGIFLAASAVLKRGSQTSPAACIEEAADILAKIEDGAPLDLTGCVAVLPTLAVVERLAYNRVPNKTEKLWRDNATKELLRDNRACHTVVFRLGCHLSIFRDTQRGGGISGLPPEFGVGWYIHPTGFLLKWEHRSLPSEKAGKPWPEYRTALVMWLIGHSLYELVPV